MSLLSSSALSSGFDVTEFLKGDSSFGHAHGCGCPACSSMRDRSENEGGTTRQDVDSSFIYEDSYRAIISESLAYPTENGYTQRPMVLTYSFLTEVYDPKNNENKDNFIQALNEEQREIIRQVLENYSEVTNITFLETKDAVGDINFGMYSMESDVAGYAYYPDAMAFFKDGEFHVDRGNPWAERGLVAFNWSYFLSHMDDFKHVATHEIGHALGLEHPHDGNVRILARDDDGSKTVMSYSDPRLDHLGPYDVEALHALYGTPDTVNPIRWEFDGEDEILTQWGTSKGEYLRGTRTEDHIHTGGGADAIVTFDGDDIIYADSLDIEVNAGIGLDFVHVAKSSSEVDRYERYSETSGRVTIDGETARLLNVERVEFEDKTLAFDVNGTAGSAYRLYNAILDRTPDLKGLGYWTRLLDDDKITLKQMAYFGITSSEFIARNGDILAMSDEDFMTLIYGNILDRRPDLSGLQYWLRVLENGLSREEVVVYAADSVENRNAVDGDIEGGFWYI